MVKRADAKKYEDKDSVLASISLAHPALLGRREKDSNFGTQSVLSGRGKHRVLVGNSNDFLTYRQYLLSPALVLSRTPIVGLK